MTETDDASPTQPVFELFDDRAAYQQAVDRLLTQPGRELRLFDPDLVALDLGSPQRIARLQRFLLASRVRRLYIAVHETDALTRGLPRMMVLLKLFSHAIHVHRTQEDIRELPDAFLLLDSAHFVRRPAATRFRGVLCLHDENEASAMRARFEEIWAASYPAVSATTIGL